MLFVKYPELLKGIVAELLGIPFESIEKFEITNPEMPPESLGDKFCRLDINMEVDGQRVDLEIQVNDEGDFPERALYHWAREYSTALPAGQGYSVLPRTIIISIISFPLFDCTEFHSEFQPLEVTRHTLLSDKMSLHFFAIFFHRRCVVVLGGRQPAAVLRLAAAKKSTQILSRVLLEISINYAVGGQIFGYPGMVAAGQDEHEKKQAQKDLCERNEIVANPSLETKIWVGIDQVHSSA